MKAFDCVEGFIRTLLIINGAVDASIAVIEHLKCTTNIRNWCALSIISGALLVFTDKHRTDSF